MLHTVVLICSLAIAPQDCSRDTAQSVTIVDGGNTMASCGLFGQATIAPTAIKPGAGEYQKIVCERNREKIAKSAQN